MGRKREKLPAFLGWGVVVIEPGLSQMGLRELGEIRAAAEVPGRPYHVF